jgi:recombinational DNA repair protein (RecF pathway)
LLIRMLAARDPHPEIFEAYRETLHGLADPHEREAVLRVFEVRFLAEIGYALPLDHDAESGFRSIRQSITSIGSNTGRYRSIVALAPSPEQPCLL